MKIRRHTLGFTILELMIAIGIFSMVLASIYSIWSGILKASKAARNAADAAQRARIAIRTLEDALLTSQMFTANMPPQNPDAYYAFLADSSGEFTSLSFVAHLPATFPGVGRYGDNIVRRVTFRIVNAKDGTLNLVMEQGPMLMAIDEEFEPYSLVLAKDVQFFIVEFWGRQKDTGTFDWGNEWKSTNSLPNLVRVGIGVGKTAKKGDAQDVVTRVIALPANAIAPEWQSPLGAAPPRLPGNKLQNPNQPPIQGGQFNPGLR